ncbi:MAG: MFS transporter [Balneolaceae bacterium]
MNSSGTPLLRDSNLYAIFGITLTSVMGVASVAPALPAIAKTLDVATDQIGLVITFYTLPGLILIPILGVLADRFSRKLILIPSLLVFGIAGVACVFAETFQQLLFFRALQGGGSAALGVLNLTLLGDLYAGNRRATAMGYNGSVLSVGTAIYPAIGGALALFAWYYPFYLTLLAIPTAIYATIWLDAGSSENGLELNVYFSKIKTAILNARVIALLVGIFLTFIILYGGYLTFFTILLDEKFGKSTLVIGLMLSGSSLVTAVAASQLGRLTQIANESTLILIASVLYTLIFLMIPFIDNVWWFIPPILLFGAAQGINIPSILNLLTGAAPKEYRAAFLSVNWVVMRSAQALGPYLLGLIYLYYSLDGTFYFTAAVGGLFILVNLILLRPTG